MNTADIGDFCIEKLKGVGQGRKCVYCYTGELATQVSLMLGPLVCDTDPYLDVSHTHVNPGEHSITFTLSLEWKI